MNGAFLKTLCTNLDVGSGELGDALGYTRHAIEKWISRNADLPSNVVPLAYSFFEDRVSERHKTNRQVLDMLYGYFEQPSEPVSPQQQNPNENSEQASKFKLEPAYENPRGIMNPEYLLSRKAGL